MLIIHSIWTHSPYLGLRRHPEAGLSATQIVRIKLYSRTLVFGSACDTARRLLPSGTSARGHTPAARLRGNQDLTDHDRVLKTSAVYTPPAADAGGVLAQEPAERSTGTLVDASC